MRNVAQRVGVLIKSKTITKQRHLWLDLIFSPWKAAIPRSTPGCKW